MPTASTTATHSSIVNVTGIVPRPERRMPIGDPRLDAASPNRAALADNAIAIIDGLPQSGRTQAALRAAAAAANSLRDTHRTVLIGTVLDDPDTLIDRLRGLGLTEDVLTRHVRLASTPTLTDLVVFVAATCAQAMMDAQAAGRLDVLDHCPALLVVDDLGAIDARGSDEEHVGAHEISRRAWQTLPGLCSGAVSEALTRRTGVTMARLFGATWPHGVTMGVLATTRTRRAMSAASRERPPGSCHLATTADLIVHTRPDLGSSMREGHLVLLKGRNIDPEAVIGSPG